MNINKLKEIALKFQIEEKNIYIEQYGNGHINTTAIIKYKINNKMIPRYILQEVNTKIFEKPKELIDNIDKVTKHLRDKLIDNGENSLRAVLNLRETIYGEKYYIDAENSFFRMYDYIENSKCYDIVTKEILYEGAKTFGKFVRELQDFDESTLYDILPDFHNIPKRYKALEEAVYKDSENRKENCKKEIEFIRERKKFCNIIQKHIDSGEIPLRVCHNDTKLNNILFDQTTKKGLCIIDLDTVMKGAILYDFGDSIRSGASYSKENEIYCDLEKYEMFVKGYLEETKDILTTKEKENLVIAPIVITLELGMRYLTDYLTGDKYFKIHMKNHNLIRAKNQFKLILDMEKKLEKMVEISSKYL